MVNLFYNFFNYINNENYCGLLNINNKFIILVSANAEKYILKNENILFFPFDNKCQYYLLEINDYSILSKNIKQNFLLHIKENNKKINKNLLKKIKLWIFNNINSCSIHTNRTFYFSFKFF